MRKTLLPKKQKLRVFFAIKPCNSALTQLALLAEQLAATYGGKKTQKANIHLTLLFIGEIPIEQVALLRAAANNITARTFHFSVDEIRYWKKNQIIYAATKQCAPELLGLVNNLKSVLSANGFTFDSRTYKPHITLVRKTRPEHKLPNLKSPIKWRVSEWFLFYSKHTNHEIDYISLDCWPLSDPYPPIS